MRNCNTLDVGDKIRWRNKVCTVVETRGGYIRVNNLTRDDTIFADNKGCIWLYNFDDHWKRFRV